MAYASIRGRRDGRNLCLRAKGHEDLGLPDHYWVPMRFVEKSEIALDLAYSIDHGKVWETLNALPARWEELDMTVGGRRSSIDRTNRLRS